MKEKGRKMKYKREIDVKVEPTEVSKQVQIQ
jgi:hypothetical protein